MQQTKHSLNKTCVITNVTVKKSNKFQIFARHPHPHPHTYFLVSLFLYGLPLRLFSFVSSYVLFVDCWKCVFYWNTTKGRFIIVISMCTICWECFFNVHFLWHYVHLTSIFESIGQVLNRSNAYNGAVWVLCVFVYLLHS